MRNHPPELSRPRIFCGVDPGKLSDPFGIVVLERKGTLQRCPVTYGWTLRDQRCEIRYLERLRLRTGYVEGANRVRTLLRKLHAVRDTSAASTVSPNPLIEVVLDSTGLGEAVGDILVSAVSGSPAPVGRAPTGGRLVRVIITGGERATCSDGRWHVPKADLISNLQVMLEQRILRVSAAAHDAQALLHELAQIAASPGRVPGAEKYAAPASGHDDLVMALALAAWRANRPEEPDVNGRNRLFW